MAHNQIFESTDLYDDDFTNMPIRGAPAVATSNVFPESVVAQKQVGLDKVQYTLNDRSQIVSEHFPITSIHDRLPMQPGYDPRNGGGVMREFIPPPPSVEKGIPQGFNFIHPEIAAKSGVYRGDFAAFGRSENVPTGTNDEFY